MRETEDPLSEFMAEVRLESGKGAAKKLFLIQSLVLATTLHLLSEIRNGFQAELNSGISSKN